MQVDRLICCLCFQSFELVSYGNSPLNDTRWQYTGILRCLMNSVLASSASPLVKIGVNQSRKTDPSKALLEIPVFLLGEL